jgi:hypothetical protein
VRPLHRAAADRYVLPRRPLILAIARPRPSPRALRLALGLIFSLAGDIFLMLPTDRFREGLASFLAAHVCYIAAFASRSSSTWRDLLMAVRRRARFESRRPGIVGPHSFVAVALPAAYRNSPTARRRVSASVGDGEIPRLARYLGESGTSDTDEPDRVPPARILEPEISAALFPQTDTSPPPHPRRRPDVHRAGPKESADGVRRISASSRGARATSPGFSGQAFRAAVASVGTSDRFVALCQTKI